MTHLKKGSVYNLSTSTLSSVFNNSFSIGALNSSNNSAEERPVEQWSFEFSVILACILSVSAFCTVIGNSMVLMVIIRHRGMRTRTNLFLLNLAVTDLLVGLFVVPFTITTLIQNKWIFGDHMCLLNGWMNGFCLITSFHTLMYISIHKYFSIVRPLSNPLKLNYIIAMMAAAWLWSAFCSTLNITVLVVEYKQGTSQCGPRYPDSTLPFIIHGLLQFTVIYVPASILVFCYVRMFVEIKKHSQRLRTNSTVEEDFILSQQKKVTITLFIVLATFVMMALPYHIYATYTTIKTDKEHFSSYMNPVAYTFLYLSSMCNPIIYAFRSPAFREGYKEILCQTPNYVISDESDWASRVRRLSSLISNLHRTTSGPRNVVTDISNKTLSRTQSEPGVKPMKPELIREKSLLQLLRSTRMSRAQSVVHRNGDVIIMKGGKIVSVRPGGEVRDSTPLLDRIKNLKETNDQGPVLKAGLTGPGQVMVGLVCDAAAGEVGDLVYKENMCAPGNKSGFPRQADHKQNKEHPTSDHKQKKEHPTSDPTDEDMLCFAGNGTALSYLEKNSISKTDKNVSDSSLSSDDAQLSPATTLETYDVTEQSSLPASSGIGISAEDFQKPSPRRLPGTKTHEDKKSRSKKKPKLPYIIKPSSTDTSAASLDSLNSSGIIIHLDDDNDVLSVMPLTPQSYLAKSDMHIPQNDSETDQLKKETSALKAQQMFHSSEHILKKPPSIQRLPSLEFLDPPVHMFRSRSNVSIHSPGQRRHRASSKSPKKRDRSESPDVRCDFRLTSSKSSFLMCHFSPRNVATQV